MAKEFSKPVVIHCREAVDDTLAMMKNFASVPAVFHCFTGTVAESQRILEAGYFLGFTGVMTFKKSDALREAVRLTPRDRLFVETDAPYLSPEPFRSQKTNEPALVIHTATAIAQQWGVGIEEVDRVTTENVRAVLWMEMIRAIRLNDQDERCIDLRFRRSTRPRGPDLRNRKRQMIAVSNT